ncbi:MAG: hypothetical protein GC189_01145 [Alphaproteobacteria bacterium]|nr:hypothetical protein [Alphaproteobacteria bacterium]
MSDDEPPPNDLAALWRAARYWANAMLNLFGGPNELPWDNPDMPRRRIAILQWLRPLERLARWLLLAQALNGPAPVLEPRHGKTRRKAASKPVAPIDWTAPSQTWRVRFDYAPAGHRASLFAKAKTKPRPKRALWAPSMGERMAQLKPLALRVEAVVRVILAPDVFAKRLARRLARNAAAAHRILRVRPLRQPVNPMLYDYDAGHALAWAALPPAFINSS